MPVRPNTLLRRRKAKAGLLVLLMLLLPFGSMTSEIFERTRLSETPHSEGVAPRSWGVNGSNDTGWIDLDAVGSDPENGTPAYADLMLEFAPGSIISNLTLEIAMGARDTGPTSHNSP